LIGWVVEGASQDGELVLQRSAHAVALRDHLGPLILGIAARSHLAPDLEPGAVPVQRLHGAGAVVHGGGGAFERANQVDAHEQREDEGGGADRHGDTGSDEGVILHRDGE
jgi:hypothetical protein